MKKLISAALAAIVLTAALSGCDNGGNSSGESSNDSSSSSSSSSSTSSSTSTDTSTSSSEESSSSTSTESSTESSSSTSSSTESSTSSTVTPDPPVSNKTAKDYVDAALSTDEWSMMEIIPDDALEFVLAGFNTDWVSDYCFSNIMMSADTQKVFVAKPKPGNEATVKKFFDDHIESLKGGFMYPHVAEASANWVTGTTPDGFVYLICHKNGPDIASYMIAHA